MKKLLLSLSFMALVFITIKAEDDLTINETTALEQTVSTENNDPLIPKNGHPIKERAFLDLSIREIWQISKAKICSFAPSDEDSEIKKCLIMSFFWLFVFHPLLIGNNAHSSLSLKGKGWLCPFVTILKWLKPPLVINKYHDVQFTELPSFTNDNIYGDRYNQHFIPEE
jgi:hypothetical protein